MKTMNRRIYISLFFLVTVEIGFSQGTGGSQIYITDLKGTPVGTSNYADIIGTPFFFDVWNSTKITFSNNAVNNNIQAKVNIYTSEIHYLDEHKVERVFLKGQIKEVSFFHNGDQYTFKGGPPVNNTCDKNTLYQIVADGDAQLTKCLQKSLIEVKEYNSAVSQKKFVDSESYYIFVNSGHFKVKREKDFLLEVFSDKKNAVEEFIDSNKLKLRKDADLIKVVSFYNSLPK